MYKKFSKFHFLVYRGLFYLQKSKEFCFALPVLNFFFFKFKYRSELELELKLPFFTRARADPKKWGLRNTA